MSSINNPLFATTYPEAFPSYLTIQKLIKADRLIIADNIAYNKREKVNQLIFSEHLLFTIPIKNENKIYSELQFDNQSNWRRKLIRLLDDQFAASIYYHFHQGELQAIINQSDTYLGLSIAMINFVLKVLNVDRELLMASDICKQFDLQEICKKITGVYLVEKKYSGYLNQNQFKNTQFIDYKDNLFSFSLLMEHGPYLKNL